MKKIAVICNSINPDLAMYFTKKVEFFDEEIVFFANKLIASKLGIPKSSYSTVSGFSWRIFLDCFLSFFVFFKILINRVSVVVFDTAHIANLPIAILCKLARINLVFTIHDWNPHEGEQQKAVQLYNQFVKKMLADQFVVFSKVNSDKPIHQLNLSGFDKCSGECANGYYLFFGRIEPYKGLKYLVEIANELIRLGKSEKIVVAGKGYDEALSELEALPNVDVLNTFIEDSTLDALLKGAIATLLPYDSATQSGVIIHSYAYSKPVVAFDVGELASYISQGESGCLVKHGEIQQFVSCMLDIKEQEKNYRNGADKEFKKYDNAALERQYRELFIKLQN
jgi:glycosyltransferase involved in cell wall biosynthesis